MEICPILPLIILYSCPITLQAKEGKSSLRDISKKLWSSIGFRFIPEPVIMHRFTFAMVWGGISFDRVLMRIHRSYLR